MDTKFSSQLFTVITPPLCLDTETYRGFLRLIKQGRIIKADNPEYHCCAIFTAFNPKTKQIFVVHHKRARQWVIPGGHIEKGELLEDAVRREAKEELGMNVEEVGKPFMASIMPIQNDGQPCKAHYDLWYVLPTTDQLQVDYREFHETKWVSIKEAKQLITHKTYLQALERIEALFIQ